MKFLVSAFVFSLLILALPGWSVCQVQKSSPKQYVQSIPSTGVTFEMIFIPSGKFLMGSSDTEPGRNEDEDPRHQVSVDSVWVGKVEVTWELFGLFLNENKSLFTSLPQEHKKAVDAVSRPSSAFEDPSMGMGRKSFPVVNVSPYAALTFCKWLSIVTGRFYRLPTEAEWEYICRAGAQTAYSHGDDLKQLKDYAVYFDNSNGQYAAVASKKPNAWGVHDMQGNVSEWTLDEYGEDFYTTSSAPAPWNKPTSLYGRVYRGGSWDDEAADLRSAARKKSGISLQKDDPQIPKSFWWYTNASFIGFRLVSPAKAPDEQEIKKFWAIVLDE
ncbi:MAG: SUMF1/EgtB/PvdO family nonheme iron enzyme [Cyclobacteriaceae bacterium]